MARAFARPTPSELRLSLSRDLAEYIERAGIPPGTHLKEQALADRFGVSRTPVRGALALLVDSGLVERRTNHGYFVGAAASSVDRPRLALPATETERLYVRVARDWFAGRLERELSASGFCRRYGIGRTLAARVLSRLSEDGVIRRIAGRGWTFEPTLDTREAHDESYRFRMTLEPAAIELETFRLDRVEAAGVRRRHEEIVEADPQELSVSLLFDLDARFHRMIGRCARNRFFLGAIERQNNLRRLVEYASLLDADRLAASCAEHLGMLDRLEAGDRQGAAELMREHLATAVRFGPRYSSKDDVQR